MLRSLHFQSNAQPYKHTYKKLEGFDEILRLISTHALQENDKEKIYQFIETNKNQPDIINKQNNIGHSMLLQASYYGHTDIVNKLLSVKDIEINSRNIEGCTPLMLAASKGHVDIVKALVSVEGINLSAVNIRDETATTLAISNRNQTSLSQYETIIKTIASAVFQNAPTDDDHTVSEQKAKTNMSAFLTMAINYENSAKTVPAILAINSNATTLHKQPALSSTIANHSSDVRNSLDENSELSLTKETTSRDSISETAEENKEADETSIEDALQNIKTLKETQKKDLLSSEDLWKWLDNKSVAELNPLVKDFLVKNKDILKDLYLNKIKQLDNPEQLRILKQIFTDKNEKNNTAMAEIFWAGNTSLYANRLGEAYKLFLKRSGHTAFSSPQAFASSLSGIFKINSSSSSTTSNPSVTPSKLGNNG